MAIPTTAQHKAIADLYIALFNRAPDADGFNFWTQALANGAALDTIARNFVTTPEARAVYPDSLNGDQFVSTYYSNVLGRPIDANGLAFWTKLLEEAGGVNSAAARAMVVAQIIDIVSTPLLVKPSDLTDEAYALTFADRNAFKNKSEVAIYYAVEYKGTDLNLAKQVLAVVGPTASTIDVAKALLNPPSGGGGAPVAPTPPAPVQTIFNGTTGVDTFIAGPQDSIFNFLLNGSGVPGSTLTTGDTITGGDGADRLNLTTSGFLLASSTAIGAISGIETVAIKATSGTTIFNVGADVKTVISDASSGGVSFGNLSAGATYIIDAATGGHQSANYTTFVTSGKLIVNGGVSANVSAAIQGEGLGARLASVAITSSGAANALLGLSVGSASTVTLNAETAFTSTMSGSDLKSLTITGPAAVNLGALSDGWATVNASANTGALTAILGASNTAVKVTGSAGNDTISTGIVLTTGFVDAGAGSGDRLIVTNSAALANPTLGAKYTGFETLRVNNGVTVDLANINGISAVEIADGPGATGVAFADATQAGNVTILSANQSGAIAFGAAAGIDTVKATVITKLAGVAQNINLTGLTLHSNLTTLELTGNNDAAGPSGLVTLVTTNALSLKTIVIDNAGGASVLLNSSHTGTNLSIDASKSTGVVSLNVASYNTVTGAKLAGGTANDSLIGSGKADVLVGGAGNDSLSGNGGDDYLLGDGALTGSGRNEVQSLAFGGEAYNTGTYTLGNYSISVTTGETAAAVGARVTGAEKTAFLAANATVEDITYGADAFTITYKAGTGDVPLIAHADNDFLSFNDGTPVETIKGTFSLVAATTAYADRLTGGVGNDTFAFAQNSSIVTAFDTITDLNLGGGGSSVDLLAFQNPDGVASIHTLTGAQQTSVTEAADLAAAVNLVLSAAISDGTTVQFTYGADTFIAHNGDGNGTFDNVADFLIKVTGLTGTLDATDIVLV